MRKKVEQALAKVRPLLQADGGDVDLLDVNENTGVVTVKLTGSCGGCPFATVTLKQSIEHTLKEEVPQVTEVRAG
ncbi:MAG TPA: NifU family protein [bacterium]|jgi:Fe-S cluster biogenesis protein NfuA|nr:NifU family protein [bacterium]